MDIHLFDKTISGLRDTGWLVQKRQDSATPFDRNFNKRYLNIPDDYLFFLEKIKYCSNPSQTAWFLTEPEYRGTNKSAFRWDELELLSIDAADGDSNLVVEIREFWDHHMPIMLSVKSGYAYVGIKLSKEGYGSVICGIEPEYESITRIADTFTEFMELLVKTASGENRKTLLHSMI